MKYDCELIQDIVSLYKEGVLSNRSQEIVNDHLRECPVCRNFYDSYSSIEEEKKGTPDPETKAFSAFASKIRQYHFYQTGVFILSIILMLTISLPWFGYKGVTEVKGTVLFNYPLAILGFAFLQFAIWFPFQDHKRRSGWGYTGLGLILLTQIYLFISMYTPSTAGLDLWILSIDVPDFSQFHLLDCFRNARWGFYAGVLLTVTEIIAFTLFSRKIK